LRLRKYQRRLLLGLGLVGAGLVVLWLALPLWFPWVLSPLARRNGATYSRYERLSYGRFVLHNLTFTNSSLRFQAERIEAYVPSSWLWHLRTGHRLEGSPFLEVNAWSVDSLPSTNAAATSTTDEIKSLAGTLAAVHRWLPQALTTNGTIRLPGDTLSLGSLTWSNGVLSAQAYSSQLEVEAKVHAALAHWPLTVELQSEPLHTETHLSVSTNLSGLELKASGLWLSNRVELEAHFGKNGYLPETAQLRVPDLRVPGQEFGLPIYEDLTGSLNATWTAGGFALALDAHAHPLAARTNLPPITLAVRARGDTNAVIVQTATISSSWIEARLFPQLNIHFSGPLIRQPALFEVTTSLDALSGLGLHGILKGNAELQPTRGKFPSVQFRLSGSEVGRAAITASSLSVEGSFAWPLLKVSRAQAGFPDGSFATVSGEVELETNALTNGHVEMRGPFGREWLPEGYSYEGLQLVGALEGPLDALRHHGNLFVTNVVTPKLRPLQLRADWSGEQTKLEQLSLLARSSNSSAQVDGALKLFGEEIQLQLARFSLMTNDEPFLSLAQPCEMTLRMPKGDGNLALHTTSLVWTGSAGQIEANASLDWPRQGQLALSLNDLFSAPFATFLQTNIPGTHIEKLMASVDWSNSPARLALNTSLTQTISNTDVRPPATPNAVSTASPSIPASFAAQVQLAGDENGLVISNLVVFAETSAVVVIHGSLPLTFNPGSTNSLVNPILHQACDLTAQAQPQAFIWERLARWTGLEINQPNLRARLSGTWDEPLGQVAFRAQGLHFLAGHTNLPIFKNLVFNLDISPQQARLTQGQVLVQGQRIELTGQLPLDPDSWTMLLKKQPPDWARASLRLKIPAADVAAFEPLVPNILAPQGTLTADIALNPGGKLDGEMKIEGARTHPLGNFGSIRDIDVRLRFNERALKLQSATASLSGAPLLLAGEVDLRGTEWLRGVIPPFHFTMRGSNVPLAREPEFIVRSDLDLAVDKTHDAPAVISGTARLRDSYYLSDLRLLAPGQVTTSDRRPPYFSIDEPAVANWRLAVNVQGERFLKVRTTLFNGVISATLKLAGTLQDPIALGDLKIDSGTVRFPFASLDVQQGLITLNSQDPYHPQISLTAASKQYGYDIRMSVSGPADAPIIQFSSTPPLSSEQILLMVTAGQLPQGTFNLTSQQRAETLALFLGRDLLAKLGIGDQGQQRLVLHSGEEISEQGKPTYRVEYKLSDRWSLVGEYDRFGDFNAGLKWRVYSK
jgi:translocation and assembly module TamB